ncbi:integrase, catalytic region, zinc finger, CCHC-type containing protein [Tanacetum coccineum]
MDEFIVHVSEKTYAYGVIRAENQDLLSTISELKTRLEKVEKDLAVRSNTCYVRNLQGDDLLTGGRDSNLYTISISDMAASSPVCLMSKATSTKSWLWHRRLSHLNFGTINDLTRLDLVDGLPKFKYGKDHLCSACERGKSKKASHPPKLWIITLDTWVYFLCSKDETPEIIKKFIAQAQLNYKAKVCKIRTDNGTEFKNTSLKAHYEKLGIMQQFSIARTPQQNVVERRNRTLVEVECLSFLGFRIYNRRSKMIMETIHVKFDELTAMASEHDCWSSKKQDCTAMSTAEAEYVSLSACCAQVIFMRTQLLDYGYKYNWIPMYCDSKSVITISCNPVQHSKTKHIDIRYHFIKEHVEKGTVEIYFVRTEYQLADLFIKAIPKERFEYLVYRIGMRCMTPTQFESLTKLSS